MAHMFGMKHDIHKRVSALTTTQGWINRQIPKFRQIYDFGAHTGNKNEVIRLDKLL